MTSILKPNFPLRSIYLCQNITLGWKHHYYQNFYHYYYQYYEKGNFKERVLPFFRRRLGKCCWDASVPALYRGKKITLFHFYKNLPQNYLIEDSFSVLSITCIMRWHKKYWFAHWQSFGVIFSVTFPGI